MTKGKAPRVDRETIRRLLIYCPYSGLFVWRQRSDVEKAWNTRYSGKQAGTNWKIGQQTYRRITALNWPFLAHRLAVLYMTGEWPAEVVDHADGDGTNNKWNNLRLANKSQNLANSKVFRNNVVGLRGVTIHKPTGKYRATIQEDGKQKYIGHFDTAAEAHAAYVSEAQRIYGEFAREDYD